MKFQVFGTVLERLDREHVPSGNKGSITAEFFFKDETWKSVEKTVIFSTKKDRQNVLIVDDKCKIPEFCTSEESCFATLIGVKEDFRIATNMIKIWFRGNCFSSDNGYVDPVQHAYEQVLIRLLGIENTAFEVNSKLSNEVIAKVVEEYMVENPIPGVTAEQVTSAVNEYLKSNPVQGVTTEQVTAAVTQYMNENPVAGVTTEQISTAVNQYLIDNPVQSGLTETQVSDKITEATTQISEQLSTQSKEIEEIKKNGVGGTTLPEYIDNCILGVVNGSLAWVKVKIPNSSGGSTDADLVVGSIADDNSIGLSELQSGKYTLYYEDANGNKLENWSAIGEVEV